ncbi:L-glutamate gamma-semialdehyde dehydrogenase [Methylibium petroleiphilum]|uniref:L-glutamate gamma-semialdehyde dehydrogenase n=1 Tax=Methylibium petroleiphilum TaxID=105560 RepID=UPI001AC0DD4A|nr:L-glutamate gamma-semialdehyde dehydrogenase [Methylibium petroleiphilum]MBN9205864.1 L-glutamate gamma-semialdehyde dehydrogenase [Methylibium petroleiphilum]
MSLPTVTPAARLPSPLRDEAPVVQARLAALAGALDWAGVQALARPWVQAVRDEPAPFWAMESLLREYPISSAEGLALMRLAEALLRVPDAATAIALTADQLGRADFEAADGDGPHKMLASLSASAIALSKRFLPDGEHPPGLLQRLGAQTVVAATVRAIQLLGRQFVLGQSIGEALGEARSQRKAQPQLRFSFDMLGEGARTAHDAQRYLRSYRDAIAAIAAAAVAGAGPEANDGISIKLSALFPRYEDSQRARVFAELLPRVLGLVDDAAAADINLTVDAEESDRLELSLELIDAAAEHIAAHHPHWRGFGLAIQAYQTRAEECVHEVARIARAHGLRFMVRLVKGAYWDGEIKRAQELGLAAYPVFTHKHHTDISYLACAKALLDHADVIYPQFATHNAGTVAAIVQMARVRRAPFELQRLHGMGEGVYREIGRSEPLPLRIYAPVGEHRDLLAYLVRRLLENGANSSFVHQLADPQVDVDALLASPLQAAPEPGQPSPLRLYGRARRNALGVDLSIAAERAPLLAAVAATRVPQVAETPVSDIDATMRLLHAGQVAWNDTPLAERAAVLLRAADRLEAELPAWCGLLVKEAHKTLGDCVAELREAVDFCRYYALQAQDTLGPRELPGPTGESNTLHLHGRGVFVCISPWNFPLAIFAGQVVAALVAGNSVAAKPAEQTPAVAQRFVGLLHAAGVPQDALALLHGPGETVGAALVAHPLTAGVCFTGSTQVAKLIQRALAAKDGAIVPLIAETGGLNAMVVDSSALPEQVADAVVQSAFRSAGQRCSALRLLCVHEGIADGVIAMIGGALQELAVGDPADYATDVGPVIDAEAHAAITRHLERLDREATLLARRALPDGPAGAQHIAPCAYELARVADLRQEVFGPVLHVVRWGPGTAARGGAADVEALVGQINALGYGLTLGVQTRIDSRAQRIAHAARVGNVYVNRNMIGAVVGVQPFGGEGLSGTGPKAGGPLYLYRFCAEQVVTVNTAAAGGNAALLAGAH